MTKPIHTIKIDVQEMMEFLWSNEAMGMSKDTLLQILAALDNHILLELSQDLPETEITYLYPH